MNLIILQLLAIWFSLANALYTPKGSSCSVACGTQAQNFTGTSDLVCLDTAYNDNTKGVLFKGCVECLGNSTFVNDTVSYLGNSDQYWYLWHVKYVQQYCLVDTPQTAAAENCMNECSPLKTPLDVSWIYNKAGVQPQYGYCSWNSSQYMTYAKECATCLQGQEGGVIIGNMADTTYNACKTQPMVTDGSLVKMARDLFDSSLLNENTSTQISSTTDASSSTTPPTATSTSRATSLNPTTTSSTSSPTSTVSKAADGLSSAASAGIGVAAALVAVGTVAGVFFVLRQKRTVAHGHAHFAPLPGYPELGNSGQVSEIGGGEKTWSKSAVVEVEAKSVQLQELDGSSRQWRY